MLADPVYSVTVASREVGTDRFVIVDRTDTLHAASRWLESLHDVNRSPNTIKQYGARVAWYLSWTAQTSDWRSVTLPHLTMWRRTLASSPVVRTDGSVVFRSPATVNLWMTAVRSFYEWADGAGLLTSDVARSMTQMKYFAPGTAGGGEHGARRQVLTDGLRAKTLSGTIQQPEWIDDEAARVRLETLLLSKRDRLLVDLMYFAGIRAGEALSLFTADLHFGGGSPELGCRIADPHFHIRLDNPVANGARAKGRARVLYVGEDLVDEYVDYAVERHEVLGDSDTSPHVFVNLYAKGPHRGEAMRYSGVRKLILRCGELINFELNGPHMLRHTFATRLIRGIGCEPQPLDVVQDILGHRSIDSTTIYTHDLERAKKDAMLAITPRRVALRESRP